MGLLLLCSRYSLQALLLASPMQDSKNWKVPPFQLFCDVNQKKRLDSDVAWLCKIPIGFCSYYHRTSYVCFRFGGHASQFPIPTLHRNTSSFSSSLLKSELGMRAAGHSIKFKRHALLETLPDLKESHLMKSTRTRMRPPSTVRGFASSTLLERASGLLPWLSE